MTKPASIRYNNPGAQYPGPSARKFGSTRTEIIGGGHKIAVFDDPVNGAAAQFDLLNRAYVGMPLSAAIAKWSGGNSSAAYAARISNATGIPLNAVLTPDMLRNPAVAVPLARTAADWETGGRYPMTDEQWQAAHSLAFGGAAPRANVAMNGSISGGEQPAPMTTVGATPASDPDNGGAIEAIVNSVFPTGDKGASPTGGGLFGSLGGVKIAGNDDTTQAAQQAQQAAASPHFQHTPLDPARLREVIARRPTLGFRSA